MDIIWDGFSGFGITWGIIGIQFTSAAGKIAANAIAIAILILAAIGLVSIIKFLAGGRRKKETPGEKWLRTGKM